MTDVYLASFAATYDFSLAHTDEEVRGWIAGYVVVRLEAWVADDAGVVGLMALSNDMIEQLYVHPERTGEGIGGHLVELAKERRSDGLGP